ncbi:hypothetical protein SISSUDRAFT_1066076 [Sistotremastrum suecicum HHB10207 ss-3]|uniref:Cyanovirin-N domain-containing protein n=1 Tax=Sistotremastrum suecicum HHB10207 ss-3 TaxID=1314776 RepID=A0A165YRL4_9AGAM|nr:hypothetical protein SISSUDRAFT_1066076 [Sistotremastrum suecicum HHB10207 ss-3]
MFSLSAQLSVVALAIVCVLAASPGIPSNPCTTGAIGVGSDITVDASSGFIVDNNCHFLDNSGGSSPVNSGPGHVCGSHYFGGSIVTCDSNFVVTSVQPPDGVVRSTCAPVVGLAGFACGATFMGGPVVKYCCT